MYTAKAEGLVNGQRRVCHPGMLSQSGHQRAPKGLFAVPQDVVPESMEGCDP